jgi:putative long chain acyl-CoA synthase
MLLLRADSAADSGHDVRLQDVFERGDAWIATGDLFWRDSDGDLWLVDSATALIRIGHGIVFPRAIADAPRCENSVHDESRAPQIDRRATGHRD